MICYFNKFRCCTDDDCRVAQYTTAYDDVVDPWRRHPNHPSNESILKNVLNKALKLLKRNGY